MGSFQVAGPIPFESCGLQPSSPIWTEKQRKPVFSKRREQTSGAEQRREASRAVVVSSSFLAAPETCGLHVFVFHEKPVHYTKSSQFLLTTSFNGFQLSISYQNLVVKKILIRLYILISGSSECFIFQDNLELEVLIRRHKSKEWKFQVIAGRRQDLLEDRDILFASKIAFCKESPKLFSGSQT